MTIELRTATHDDSDVVRLLDSHVRGAELRRVIDAGRVMVAIDQGMVVALLRWGLFWDEIPFMNMLVVNDTYRRRGIATRLVDAWETMQRQQGHTLVLTSTQSDESAQTLYRHLGYVDCGCLILPGDPLELILKKALAD